MSSKKFKKILSACYDWLDSNLNGYEGNYTYFYALRYVFFWFVLTSAVVAIVLWLLP